MAPFLDKLITSAAAVCRYQFHTQTSQRALLHPQEERSGTAQDPPRATAEVGSEQSPTAPIPTSEGIAAPSVLPGVRPLVTSDHDRCVLLPYMQGCPFAYPGLPTSLNCLSSSLDIESI
jgi:hypothetical protein